MDWTQILIIIMGAIIVCLIILVICLLRMRPKNEPERVAVPESSLVRKKEPEAVQPAKKESVEESDLETAETVAFFGNRTPEDSAVNVDATDSENEENSKVHEISISAEPAEKIDINLTARDLARITEMDISGEVAVKSKKTEIPVESEEEIKEPEPEEPQIESPIVFTEEVKEPDPDEKPIDIPEYVPPVPVTVTLRNVGNGKEYSCSMLEELEIGRGVNERKGIKIPEKQISRVHCRIEQKGGKFYITDCESTFHTYVNRKMAVENMPIESGDSLGVGPFTYRILIEPVSKS